MSKRHLWFEATSRCNARCLYCYNVWKAPGAPSPAREADPGKLREVLKTALLRCEPETITFSGGEPLLRDDLEDLVRFARALSPELKAQVTTNGTLLTRRRARALREAGVTHVLIPLLSDRRQTQADLMGLDTFDAACRAILAARAAGLLACAVFVATRRNLPEMERAFRTAFALGADEWMFLRYIPGGTGLKNDAALSPDPGALVDSLERADRLSAATGLPATCGEPLPPAWLSGRRFPNVQFASCGAGSTRLAVDAAGNVRPCEQDARIIGNLFDPGFAIPSSGSDTACAGCALADAPPTAGAVATQAPTALCQSPQNRSSFQGSPCRW